MRHITKEGLQSLIEKYEGYRSKAYRDAGGVWTIAYGATIWLNGKPVHSGQTCTQEQGEQLLLRDIARFEKCVDEHLVYGVNAVNPDGAKVYVPMPQSVFDAQVSLCYNIGENAWLKSTQLKNLNSGAYIKWKKA